MDLAYLARWIADFVGLPTLLYNIFRAIAMATILFVVLFSIERYYGAPASRYTRRGFVHDLIYWFYLRTGLHSLFFSGTFMIWAASAFPRLDVNLIGGWPNWLRFIFYFMLMEFAGYWYHRWKHQNRFLWAFHATHHSQEQMTFATQARAHFLDDFINVLVVFAPLMIIGAPPQDWRVVGYTRMFLEALQHADIPWRFGPLYRVVVSPAFHAFHHSAKKEHYDSNFGNLLSIWDYLFGTAVDEPERPKQYGIEGLTMPTMSSQILGPFRTVFATYFRGAPVPAGTRVPVPVDGRVSRADS